MQVLSPNVYLQSWQAFFERKLFPGQYGKKIEAVAAIWKETLEKKERKTLQEMDQDL